MGSKAILPLLLSMVLLHCATACFFGDCNQNPPPCESGCDQPPPQNPPPCGSGGCNQPQIPPPVRRHHRRHHRHNIPQLPPQDPGQVPPSCGSAGCQQQPPPCQSGCDQPAPRGCPADPPSMGGCHDLLGGLLFGHPLFGSPCCGLFHGLGGDDQAPCACHYARTFGGGGGDQCHRRFSLLANHCGCNVPSGYMCH